MDVVQAPPIAPTLAQRIRADLRAQWRARGSYPPGDMSVSPARTRAFERDPKTLLVDAYERHGPVFTLRLLYQPVVFVLGPEANHYLLVSNASNFRWREGSMGDLIPLLGDGLLTTDGAYHRRARRIMLPAFHREQVAATVDTMVLEIERALADWRPGARVNLYGWTRRLALRIAMRALFGFDPDREGRDASMAEQFERALGFWGRDIVVQMVRGPRSPWQRMLAARAELDRVLFPEIARRRQTGERGNDILSLLLDATDEDGSALSDAELRDQVMTLLFAGHDTTTSTVTFLFYELARNAHELPALEAERDAVVGDRNPTATELVSSLPRLEMALDETLRKYPPAWVGPRRSIEPFELCGQRVPGDAFVNYSSWASHHLPDVWPEPDRFLPERFTAEAKAALPKGAYVPFGGGSRTCIGMRFGQLEIKAIAAMILRRFRVELERPEVEPFIRQMPTLSPAGGLPVVVRARE
ncbi:MAG TPA: cytochrome P450 [Thermoleophilaceae bacterium]